MAGKIEIINRALSKLGDMRLSSLDDENKAAALAASLFDLVLEAEIAAHSWNFAKTRSRLPALATSPSFGWSWQYLIPTDCLRVLMAGPWPEAVLSNYINGETRPFVIEGEHILTNHGPALDLLYLRRITDYNLFPPTFSEALAAKLAVEMAESLTGSNTKRELAWKEYERAITLARRTNAIGLPPQAITDDTWLLARQWGSL